MVEEIGLRELKFPMTGEIWIRIAPKACRLSLLNSGHVWYAVEEDDMTEKVSELYSRANDKTDSLQHYYAWRLWKIDLPVDAEGWLEFCVRTWDSSNNTEPTFVRSAWK